MLKDELYTTGGVRFSLPSPSCRGELRSRAGQARTYPTYGRRSFLTAAIAAGASSVFAQDRDWFMFVGTYTRRRSKGIYAWRCNSKGKLSALALAGESRNPSFLAIGPNDCLYAANENETGTVSAFSFDRTTGALKLLNTAPSKGAMPCHVSLDRSGKWLFAANYDSGSVAVFPVQPGGALGEVSAFAQHSGSSVNRERQLGPHAHMALPSPDNRFLLVPDLGLDQVRVYRFDSVAGSLTPNDPAGWKTSPGFGPRHAAFGNGARFVYVLGEMAAAVCVFRYDAGSGRGEAVQTISMLPDDYAGLKSGAEIAVHPNGRYLYASNREHNSIAIFAIDGVTGKLTAVDRVAARVRTPRNFAIHPNGEFLLAAGQDSNTIAVFGIDQRSGLLTPSGDPVEAPVPVSIVFAPLR
jgi:6-phosphogluconolactonase